MEYKCVICGEMVSKRQSLAYKDGRACRHHYEVSEVLEKKQAAEVRKFTTPTKPQKKKFNYKPMDLRKKCFSCEKHGFENWEFSERMLICMRKVELNLIEGENFIEAYKRASEMTNMDGVPLARFKMDRNVARILSLDSYMVGDMAGLVIFCQSCAEKIGLDFKEAFMPTLSPDQLEMGMVLHELMKDGIDKLIVMEN